MMNALNFHPHRCPGEHTTQKSSTEAVGNCSNHLPLSYFANHNDELLMEERTQNAVSVGLSSD